MMKRTITLDYLPGDWLENHISGQQNYADNNGNPTEISFVEYAKDKNTLSRNLSADYVCCLPPSAFRKGNVNQRFWMT